MTTITGNTYPVRQQLAALGGTWNKRARGWDVPDDKAADARRIVISAGPVTYSPRRPKARTRYGSTLTRFSSGAEVYTNKRGRCEDAPCCGCCS